MPVIIGGIVLFLVVFFSAILGMLIAATIGIKSNDRGHYRALRNGSHRRPFSGAGRSFSGLRFLSDDRGFGAGEAGEDGDTPSDHPPALV
ncbi:MAG: hypothetical protein M0026_07555 [Nocardiopsaceae bacterium]|nr:hypothetical protein [Nocardiopsaceae bacterium]